MTQLFVNGKREENGNDPVQAEKKKRTPKVLSTIALIFAVLALVCGILMRNTAISREEHPVRTVVAAVGGALTYVALYMLKTFIFGLSVNGLTMSGTLAKMLSKLPGSAINALFATIVAPIFYAAIRPALRRAGVLDLR